VLSSALPRRRCWRQNRIYRGTPAFAPQGSGITRHNSSADTPRATPGDDSGTLGNSPTDLQQHKPHFSLTTNDATKPTPTSHYRGAVASHVGFPGQRADIGLDLPVWVGWWPRSGLSSWPLGAWAACRGVSERAVNGLLTGPLPGLVTCTPLVYRAWLSLACGASQHGQGRDQSLGDSLRCPEAGGAGGRAWRVPVCVRA
jgi:hypothetical protein